MKQFLAVAAFLASGLVACGGDSSLEGTGNEVRGSVTASACTQHYVPRLTTYWTSLPMQADGQVGECELDASCNPTCWGVESAYPVHTDYFYCTHCP
ncbi:hypothetical protein HJC10_02915 [Corallococcus exiguus]|uniref:hypothetical protein n=1 Tax=Corallococcus TaxID=83461 RepID=UPI000ED4019E|nr:MULTISPECIES: hypothetical protein [Corallococcus]NNB84147.1 hypothetical protein [Corallococcus exiguus]NNB96130.1 hypothetical protein [Corallococcus exiguus]NNC01805.1 hypothetical protein [Corallococcus exiguus]NPC47098.1 hypothetical protein [Corallococcus exiguus]RKH83622.1 hypothetical protein D7X99_12310 [Corallococcus sp. AB032C]